MASISVYKQFLSTCDNGFVHISPDGKIIDVNRAVSELTGRSRKELEASSLKALFGKELSSEILELLKSRRTDEVSAIRYGELLQKHGPPRWVEVQANRTPEVDGDYCWLLIKNKSFRKEIEQKLRERDIMLETTLESLPFDFWINDNENRTYLQNSYSKKLWGDVRE